MNFSFYATKEDRKAILDFILNQPDWQVYGNDYISFDEQFTPVPFQSIEQIENKIEKDIRASRFVLYSNKMKGDFNISKIQLNKRRNEEQSFRFIPEGWGAIQLEFGSVWNDSLERSMISHNSEKRANSRGSFIPRLGLPSNWDWKEVEFASSSLKKVIKKLSCAKFHDGSYMSYILPNANCVMGEKNASR